MTLKDGIYLGDCHKLLKVVGDESIDLVFTSPPYDNIREIKGGGFNLQLLGKQLFRVIKPGGVVGVVIQDQITRVTTGTSFRMAVDWMDIGFNIYDVFIYYRPGRMSHKTRLRRDHEYIFVFIKRDTLNYFDKSHLNITKTKPAGKSVYRSLRKPDGKFKPPVYRSSSVSKCRGTIWPYLAGYNQEPGSKLRFTHSASFPDRLAWDFIRCFCPPGGLVLDPMAGGGVTPNMAKACGRRYMAFEIDDRFFEIMKIRLEVEG